jgi:5-methylcytosine-specific restriction endonuclease McrA
MPDDLLPLDKRRKPEYPEVQERKPLSATQKVALIEKQGKKCAICKCRPSRFEFDHKDELWASGDADPKGDNWQALCRDCHATKTKVGTAERAAMKRKRGVTGQWARRERKRPDVKVNRNGSVSVRQS